MEKTKLVAFTFDDGPLPYADDSTAMRILKTYEKYGQTATFFYWGERINDASAPEMKFAQSIGCEAGNHTFTHCPLTEKTVEEMKDELKKTSDAVENVLGVAPKLMRLPYLASNETVTATVDYPMINCSADSRDWDNATTEEIIQRIMDVEAAGELENAIILMHEPYATTAAAVEYLIPTLMEKGYRFVSVSELAKQNGVELQKHTIYGKL
ncbi:MAG: polysaccharide deacetylase family protein [Lachnospiraceae bacterium]|nr:polysaccharide deacetylase family protein [Lachnospiraceae bacterium]